MCGPLRASRAEISRFEAPCVTELASHKQATALFMAIAGHVSQKMLSALLARETTGERTALDALSNRRADRGNLEWSEPKNETVNRHTLQKGTEVAKRRIRSTSAGWLWSD